MNRQICLYENTPFSACPILLFPTVRFQLPPSQVCADEGEYVWKYDKKARLLAMELSNHADDVDCIVEVIRARKLK